MAKPILVANWKSHPGSLSEANRLLRELVKGRNFYKRLNFFIAPPASYFSIVKDKAGGFSGLGSQDISIVDKGTYTGEITSDILKSFGVHIALVGHSERRALGESSLEVAQKLKVALKTNITPILCVGELERDNEGLYFEVLRRQIEESLSLLPKKADISKVIIAYEPVWVIGKKAKDSITVRDLAQSLIFIKKVLTHMFGRRLADKVSIIYGGSVEPGNGQDLWKTGIKGFLVGHASLDAKKLNDIAKQLTQ